MHVCLRTAAQGSGPAGCSGPPRGACPPPAMELPGGRRMEASQRRYTSYKAPPPSVMLRWHRWDQVQEELKMSDDQRLQWLAFQGQHVQRPRCPPPRSGGPGVHAARSSGPAQPRAMAQPPPQLTQGTAEDCSPSPPGRQGGALGGGHESPYAEAEILLAVALALLPPQQDTADPPSRPTPQPGEPEHEVEPGETLAQPGEPEHEPPREEALASPWDRR